MTDEIAPALTPEEWARPQRRVYAREEVNGDCHIFYAGNDPDAIVVADYGRLAVVPLELRHALAALALHEQPFGFTREGWRAVEALAARTDEELDDAGCKDCPGCADCHQARLATKRARSMAARIAALLPPE